MGDRINTDKCPRYMAEWSRISEGALSRINKWRRSLNSIYGACVIFFRLLFLKRRKAGIYILIPWLEIYIWGRRQYALKTLCRTYFLKLTFTNLPYRRSVPSYFLTHQTRKPTVSDVFLFVCLIAFKMVYQEKTLDTPEVLPAPPGGNTDWGRPYKKRRKVKKKWGHPDRTAVRRHHILSSASAPKRHEALPDGRLRTIEETGRKND